MRKHLKDYFIPHEGNEYKPHSLQKAAMLGMVTLIMFSFTFANLQSLLWIGSEWLVSTVLPSVIVQLTNEERRDDALGTLKRNSTLDAAAQMKAEHMAQNEYFAHYAPDGTSPWDWFGEVDYNFIHAGENLAIHFTDSDEVVEAWMASPAHRANIMNGDYVEIGVGTAEGEFEGYKTVYVVQLFGTPAAPAPEPVAPAALAAEPQVAGEGSNSASDSTNSSEDIEVLAESVAISETIEVFEAEPVPVTSQQENENVTVSTTESGVALYSDFVSTTTPGIPASIDDVSNGTISDPSFLGSMATKPHLVLQILYSLVAGFVVLALLLSIAIEIRKQNPLQIAYSAALLLLMYGLFELHTTLVGGALIV